MMIAERFQLRNRVTFFVVLAACLGSSNAFSVHNEVRQLRVLDRSSISKFASDQYSAYHNLNNHHPKPIRKKAKVTIYNNAVSAVEEQNKPKTKNKVTTQQQISDYSITGSAITNNNCGILNNINTRALASTAILAATILSYPSFGHAVDIASIAGGGTAGTSTLQASTVGGMISSFAETGFYQAFSLVFVSEIGDKTFFMAGLLAMKTSKLISFVGSIGALIIMTLISVIIGQTFHAVPSGWLGGEGSFLGGLPLDDVAAVLAFAFFGFKTLQEALSMEEGESVMDEELAEAEEEVEASDTTKKGTLLARVLSIFGLVFAAEFGDRSFLSTIALSAAQNPVSVAVGAIAAHAIATGIAVSGGAVVAKYLSERVIGIIGGVLFIVFAVTTAIGIF